MKCLRALPLTFFLSACGAQVIEQNQEPKLPMEEVDASNPDQKIDCLSDLELRNKIIGTWDAFSFVIFARGELRVSCGDLDLITIEKMLDQQFSILCQNRSCLIEEKNRSEL